MKKLMLFLIVFNFISFVTKAQDDGIFTESRPTVLGISFDYGNLLKHTESLRQIDDAYPFAIRLDWSKHLITQESWDFCNCFPRVGVSLAYWDWDNPEVLGKGIIPLAM